MGRKWSESVSERNFLRSASRGELVGADSLGDFWGLLGVFSAFMDFESWRGVDFATFGLADGFCSGFCSGFAVRCSGFVPFF